MRRCKYKNNKYKSLAKQRVYKVGSIMTKNKIVWCEDCGREGKADIENGRNLIYAHCDTCGKYTYHTIQKPLFHYRETGSNYAPCGTQILLRNGFSEAPSTDNVEDVTCSTCLRGISLKSLAKSLGVQMI